MDRILELNNKKKIDIIPIESENTFVYTLPYVDDSHIHDPETLNPEYSLYPYQKRILAYMMAKEQEYDYTLPRSIHNGHKGMRGGILAIEMGLGKTLLTLTLHAIKNDGIPSLVVCSKSILSVWKDEAEKFYPGSLRVFIFHPDYMGREEYSSFRPDYFYDYDVVVTTYSVISGANPKCKVNVEGQIQEHGKYSYSLSEFGDPNSIRKGKVLSIQERYLECFTEYAQFGRESIIGFYWRRVILDESQTIRNFKTHTFKSVMCLYSEYKWCLSGTPLVNVNKDLWAQLRFCGYLGVKYHKDWNFQLYLRDEMYKSIYILTKEQAEIPITERIEEAVFCEMDENQTRIYKACLGELMEAYEDFKTGITGFAHVLETFLRLRQSCVAPYLLRSIETYDNDKYVHKTQESGLNATKIKKTAELIMNSDPEDKFLVFSFFKDTSYLVSEYLEPDQYAVINGETSTTDRSLISKLFHSELRLKVLFLSYKTGSEGLNLTAANRVIMVEPWWNPSTHEQAIARAWRNGQKREVKVEYLIIPDTIEDRIRKICLSKRDLAKLYLKGEDAVNEDKDENTGLTANMIAKILGLR